MPRTNSNCRYFIHILFKHIQMNFLVLMQGIAQEILKETSKILLYFLLFYNRFWLSNFSFQGYYKEMQQRLVSRFIWTLQGIEIYTNKTSLVVESKSGIWSTYFYPASYRYTYFNYHCSTLTNKQPFFFYIGLVLFLEEDHYVSPDFLSLLKLMELRGHDLCPKCNILSLGTYLKTFNYYAFNNNNKVIIE